ncbi:MAG: SWIM zinc finger family protein [Bacillota bacterium]
MAALDLRLLTESDLARLLPAPLLSAAEDYVIAERLRRPAVAGSRLAARLEGFRSDYDVAARVDGDGLTTTCTCGRRQPCRHAAALVLAWMRRRSWFVDLDALLQPLADRPGEELVALLGRIAVEPGDRLAPLEEAANIAVSSMTATDGVAGRDAGPPLPPGHWLGPDDTAAAVAWLAQGWDRALAALAEGRPDMALEGLAGRLETALRLTRRSRDEEGLLGRFLAASLGQAEALGRDARLGPAGRRLGLDLCLQVLAEGPAALAGAATAALGALAGRDQELISRARTRLLERVWHWEAALLDRPDPAGAWRQGNLIDALCDLLEGAGRGDEALAILALFPRLFRATARRTAALRRLGRLQEALEALRDGLEAAQGQAAMDIHQWAGELLVDLGRPHEAVPHFLALYLGRGGREAALRLQDAAQAAGSWAQVAGQVNPADLA